MKYSLIDTFECVYQIGLRNVNKELLFDKLKI